MIIGLVSDFLPECQSKISFGLFIHHAGTFGVIHHAGTFGVKVLSCL